MKENFPNYILSKIYDKFYLFSDNEIKFKDFISKLIFFSKKHNGKTIYGEVIIPEYYKHLDLKTKFEYSLKDENILNDFFNLDYTIEGNLIPAFSFHMLIYDNTKKWELLSSEPNELSILGCTKELHKSIINIIKPYEEVSLNDKLREIGLMFGYNLEKEKKEFLSALIKNYSLFP